jgi:Replication protein
MSVAAAVPRDVANNCGRTSARRVRRSVCWEALRALWRVSSLDRVRHCRRFATNSESGVGVKLRAGDRRAHFEGLQTCGSIWSCPCCAEKILAGRVDELLAAIEAWVLGGGRVVLVTLTMRHKLGQALSDLWDGLSSAWRSASSGNRSVREALTSVEGWVRRVECTVGRNGWHVHVHALLFVGGDVDQAGATAMGDAMFTAWAGRLVHDGFDAPMRGNGGLDVKLLDLAGAREDVAGYLAKGTYESAALELAGGSAKHARRGNRSTMEVLRDLVADGLVSDLALWREWEQASKGRRALTWKRGFRALVLGDEPELTDEELAGETDHGGELVAVIAPQDWPAVREWAAQLLNVVENSDVDDAYERLARWCARRGLPPPMRA